MVKLANFISKSMYKIYKSQTVIDNHKEFVSDCTSLFKEVGKTLNNYDSTWSYDKYNIFSYASPKKIWTDLYRELRDCAIDFIGNDKDLCYQSWLNFHLEHQLLDWHDHKWPYHGYISIQPLQSKTVFEDFTVSNEIGNIYIGHGNLQHKVECDQVNKPRITLGFDITDQQDHISSNKGLQQLFVR